MLKMSKKFNIYQIVYTLPLLHPIQQYHINVTLPSIHNQKEKGQEYPGLYDYVFLEILRVIYVLKSAILKAKTRSTPIAIFHIFGL